MKDTQPRSPDGLGERLRELAENATLGPWYTDMRPVKLDEADFSVVTSAGGNVVLVADRVLSDADAAFIAACDPQTIIALLDRIDTLTEQVRPTRPCDLFGNGGDGECGGPQFSDSQPEGVDLRVCAKHLIANRDEWMRAGSEAMDRCRETHGKHFLLVGGMMGSGDGAVPAVPFHEQPICEPELAALRSENARLTEQVRGAEGVVTPSRRALDVGAYMVGNDGGWRARCCNAPWWQEKTRHEDNCWLIELRSALSIYDEGVGKKP